MTASDWRAYCDERAAIREFNGGMSRKEAELLAWQDTLVQMCRFDPTIPRHQHAKRLHAAIAEAA